jgi:hypothetical protein
LIKHLTFSLIGFLIAGAAWCQHTVTGTVRASDDKSLLPGVNIIEKGTDNGTVTDADGRFSIVVKEANAILQFRFIAFIPKEEPVKGRDHIDLILKIDCIRDWFDLQKIGIYLVSGIVNDPVGGKFEIAFPAYFGKGTLTSSISYQSNLDATDFLNTDVKLNHFIFNCDFDMDASWVHKQVNFRNEFKSRTNSLEVNFNFNKFGIIGGYSHTDLSFSEGNGHGKYDGPLLGLRTWVNRPLRLVISAKAAIYKGSEEYLVELSRDSRYVDLFLKYYRLETFSEISLGVGTTFNYRFRKQKDRIVE